MAANGRLPASQLRPIPEGNLSREAAAAWNAMNREAKRRSGITLLPKGARSSYRSYAQQEFFWRAYRSGRGAVAARPGRSNHGWGLAVDVRTPPMAAFIRRHGRRYGWSHDEGRRVGEWWHMRYVGGYRGADPGSEAELPTLRAGAKGKLVTELQASLARKGYRTATTGDFDARTRAAVIHYQRRKGLTADGIVGPLTWQRLRARPPVLRRGDTGDAVLRLQQALDRAGYTASVDGDFGPGTEEALTRFQRDHDLGPDGVLGPATRAALRRALAAKPEAPAPAVPTMAPPELERAEAGTAQRLRLSAAGARFIAEFEGFRGRLYNDAAGHCTIGYGHLVHHGRCNGGEPAELRRGIGRDRALALLREDAEKAASAVRESVRVPLTQSQFDALVSFTFNLGGGALRESTLLRRLNQADYASVPAQLNRWVKAGGRTLPGLVRRRRDEGALFARGGSAVAGPPTSGPSTLELQRRLKALGHDPGPLDGIMGPSTIAAIRALQSAQGLAVDGILGPETERELAAAKPAVEPADIRQVAGGNGEPPTQPTPPAHAISPRPETGNDATAAGSSREISAHLDQLSEEWKSLREMVTDTLSHRKAGEPLTEEPGGQLVERIADRLESLLLSRSDAPAPGSATEPIATSAPSVVVEPPTEEFLLLRRPPITGPGVLRVQSRLRDLGHDPGPLDGIYGEATAGAVQAFQVARGLATSGVVDAGTARLLAEATPAPADAPARSETAPRIITARSIGLAFANLFGALGAELHVTGHYSAGPRALDADQGIDRAREFHALHRGKGWGGIGYHYLIPDDGTLICARPTTLKGAHTGAHNSSNVGVNMPGNTGDRPTDAQAATYRWLLENVHTDQLPKAHRTDRDLRRAKRFGHNQWSGHRSNGCPGLFLDLFVEGG